MANEWDKPVRKFSEGAPLSAAQMNQIVNMLTRRIVGGKNVNVRSFPGGQVIIDAKDQGGGLSPETAGGEGLPVVDFIVDNFDRNDSDGLGSLWDNPEGFGIRGGNAYDAKSSDLLIDLIINDLYAEAEYREFSISSYRLETAYVRADTADRTDVRQPPFVPSGNITKNLSRYLPIQQLGVNADRAETRYRAVMSTGSYNVEVTFTVDGDLPSNALRVGLNIPKNNNERGTLIDLYGGRLDAMGMSGAESDIQGIYEPTNTPFSLTTSAGSYSTSAGSYAMAVMNSNDLTAYRLLQGLNTRTFVQQFDKKQTNSTNGIGVETRSYSSKRETPPSPQNVNYGTNTLRLEVRNGVCTGYLNGYLLFGGTTMYTIDAGMLALGGLAPHLTDFIQVGLDRHITQIKAWNTDAPEPSDGQSGHGVLVDGALVYTDKYHAGGGYNPNA